MTHQSSAAFLRAGTVRRFYEETVLAYEGDECLIWPHATTGATGRAQMQLDGRRCLVPRLVCAVVHGPAPSKIHQAAHSCGKGHLGCVTKRHLSWKTPKENMADQYLHNTRVRGETCHLSKLKEADARIILKMRGKKTPLEIARDFGISRSAVYDIHKRRSWGSLEDAA